MVPILSRPQCVKRAWPWMKIFKESFEQFWCSTGLFRENRINTMCHQQSRYLLCRKIVPWGKISITYAIYVLSNDINTKCFHVSWKQLKKIKSYTDWFHIFSEDKRWLIYRWLCLSLNALAYKSVPRQWIHYVCVFMIIDFTPIFQRRYLLHILKIKEPLHDENSYHRQQW